MEFQILAKSNAIKLVENFKKLEIYLHKALYTYNHVH